MGCVLSSVVLGGRTYGDQAPADLLPRCMPFGGKPKLPSLACNCVAWSGMGK